MNEHTNLDEVPKEVDVDETSADDLMETPTAGAGDRLRSAREARRMELSHVAAETRIPIRHLESIEASAFDALPSRTYAIGFARTYARIVGLDEKSIADAVREEALRWALTGGDDYELCFCLPPDAALPDGCTVIGGVVEGEGVDPGMDLGTRPGYLHF